MFSNGKPLPKKLYIIGVIVIFAAVSAQYFVELGRVLGFLVVYGLPVAVVSLFFGREIFRRAGKNNKKAVKAGLAFFGALTVINFLLSIVAIIIITIFNPQALDLLNRLNPVLDVPPDVAWVMVAVSFLVVGPAEEYLFTGFTYGGLLNMSKGKHWLPLAVVSSLLFASAHAYYAITYEVTSVVAFITLATFSFAMAATYYFSAGNILAPALIHGIYDAAGFLTVATTFEIGLALRVALIFVGVAFAVYYFIRKMVAKSGYSYSTKKRPPVPLPPAMPRLEP
jgi:membrane protease YdiL (CAAX protease family)